MVMLLYKRSSEMPFIGTPTTQKRSKPKSLGFGFRNAGKPRKVIQHITPQTEKQQRSLTHSHSYAYSDSYFPLAHTHTLPSYTHPNFHLDQPAHVSGQVSAGTSVSGGSSYNPTTPPSPPGSYTTTSTVSPSHSVNSYSGPSTASSSSSTTSSPPPSPSPPTTPRREESDAT